MQPLIIAGPPGGGMNHLRCLLGLAPGGEIRDLSGRRVADSDKEQFLLQVYYHSNRAYTGSAIHRGPERNVWRSGSYWLRMEWLTRDLYTESRVQHDPLPPAGSVQCVPRAGHIDWVVGLYRAKCPDLNGHTVQRQQAFTGKFLTVQSDCHPVYLPDLYHRDWVDQSLAPLCDRLARSRPGMDSARRVHHRWCDLNDRLYTHSPAAI